PHRAASSHLRWQWPDTPSPPEAALPQLPVQRPVGLNPWATSPRTDWYGSFLPTQDRRYWFVAQSQNAPGTDNNAPVPESYGQRWPRQHWRNAPAPGSLSRSHSLCYPSSLPG